MALSGTKRRTEFSGSNFGFKFKFLRVKIEVLGRSASMARSGTVFLLYWISVFYAKLCLIL